MIGLSEGHADKENNDPGIVDPMPGNIRDRKQAEQYPLNNRLLKTL